MFQNIKAIFAGIVFIVVSTMLIQLVFVLLAVAYNSFAIEFVFLKDIQWVFKYLFGIPIFLAVMFVGGSITASIAMSKSIINSTIVGSVVVIGMMWSALANAELTLSGGVINLVMITAVICGGIYSKK